MSYKDNLKYDVLVVWDGSKPTARPIASFDNYGLAMGFMERYDIASTPFNAVSDTEFVLDMCYNGGLNCLFSQPGIKLPDAAGEHEYIRKSDIVKKVIMAGQFDYALPQDWLNNVVNVLDDNNYDDRQSIYNAVQFGTVWYYPKVSKLYGRVMGRPSVITSEAERALHEYIRLVG